MHNLKELLLKDFMLVFKSLKMYVTLTLFYSILALLGSMPLSFVTAVIQLVAMTLPLSTFVYDEHANWLPLPALPQGRLTLIQEKYAFVLLLTPSGLLSHLFLYALLLSFGRPPVDSAAPLLTALIAGLVINAVGIPLCYRFGHARSRPVISILLLLAFAVITAQLFSAALPVGSLSADVVSALLFSGIIVAGTLFCLSYYICSHITVHMSF